MSSMSPCGCVQVQTQGKRDSYMRRLLLVSSPPTVRAGLAQMKTNGANKGQHGGWADAVITVCTGRVLALGSLVMH
jgi:hypothetical protein